MAKNLSPQVGERTFPMGLLVMALLVIVLWGLWAGQAFFIPIFLSALLAILISPFLAWMRKHGLPEWLALTIGVLVLFLPIALIGVMAIRQAQSLMQDYPTIVASLQKWLENAPNTSWGERLHIPAQISVSSFSEQLGAGASEGIQWAVKALKTLFEAGTESVLIIIFAVLMLASREHLYRSAEKILSQFESIQAGKMLEALTSLIEKFLFAKMIVIAVISIFSIIALYLFGLKYAFLLGMLTGVLTLIPEVGFVVSLVPVLLVGIATGHSVLSNGLILGSLVGIHLIEANLLTPKLVGKKLNLNVLATFMGLFAGGLFWGVWGMLLSVPVLGVLRIVFSVVPSLEPWALLLSEREDRRIGLQLMSKAFRRARFKTLVPNKNP